VIRALVHIASATPALLLVAGWYFNRLGVDQEKTLIWESGIWAFNLLLVVLLIPLIARWADWPRLRRYRRAVGLWSFSYASAHFGFFIAFLLGWDVVRLGEELRERPYVLFGFGAWLILAVMALTSNRFAIRLLRKYWGALHKWVYVAIALAGIHYVLMIRSDYAWPATYATIAVILITARWKHGRAQKKVRSN
jgi:sulfoxide reductase heme-binding subunit YedZ